MSDVSSSERTIDAASSENQNDLHFAVGCNRLKTCVGLAVNTPFAGWKTWSVRPLQLDSLAQQPGCTQQFSAITCSRLRIAKLRSQRTARRLVGVPLLSIVQTGNRDDFTLVQASQ